MGFRGASDAASRARGCLVRLGGGRARRLGAGAAADPGVRALAPCGALLRVLAWWGRSPLRGPMCEGPNPTAGSAPVSSSPPEGPRLLTLGLGRRAVDTQERPVRSGVRGQGTAHGREAGRPFRRKAEAVSLAGARIRAERQVRPAPRDPRRGARPTRRAVEAACAGGRRAEGRRRGRPQQPDGAAGGRVFTPGLWAPATLTPEALLPRVCCGSVRVASRAVVRRVPAGLPVVCPSRRESCPPSA